MGWLWSTRPTADGLDGLDAQTRAALDREAPSPQPAPTPTPSEPSPPPASQTYRQRLGLEGPPDSSPAAIASSPDPTSSPSAPPQSLYPDGRYTHLWSTYTPPREAQHSTASQDQLTSLLTSYQTRRAEVSRAALENCVLEHIAENECFASGSLSQKMRGCREESKRFNRCYSLQARFLKAMGYMDLEVDRDGKGEERREQMRSRADGIWVEVRRREEEGKRAKREGREAPEFGPLRLGVKGEGTEEEMLRYFGERGERVREELKGLGREEREMELRLRVAEAKADEGYGVQVGRFFEQEKVDRRGRKEQGTSTLGDWLKWLGGWSQ
ncbi:hypothetical protein C1H76_6576 [Elsinoe australis]|uniref:Uncharacterized protein n=1 Tax=Elsinoe australis TaxID=40998 RepID=A0A4U7AX13_9PEZI|nr:hypothetical protein C1H76_6576 [Elsinoe australis]